MADPTSMKHTVTILKRIKTDTLTQVELKLLNILQVTLKNHFTDYLLTTFLLIFWHTFPNRFLCCFTKNVYRYTTIYTLDGAEYHIGHKTYHKDFDNNILSSEQIKELAINKTNRKTEKNLLVRYLRNNLIAGRLP